MRLKELRKSKGMQQQEAAKELNIPGSTYAGYERGEREPRIDVLIKLADYLIGHEKKRLIIAVTSRSGN
ncbi:helix-turn-helix transcriptional regulator [Weissella paramesenteroides]|uniref:helix-turn-helix domain-containing protein n=1 Tax=Weissella paramesenteroides TaxID=1249 RepID=UPI002402D81D|nr:helix-turn-helix transcriptional regulator [Weissella paramesenteroides]MDF8367078.1 helix-turn-helix transcriptional regulator [Weissella paramesenteroides]